MPDLRDAIKTLAMQEPILKIEPYLVNAGQDVMDAWSLVKKHLASLPQDAQSVANYVRSRIGR